MPAARKKTTASLATTASLGTAARVDIQPLTPDRLNDLAALFGTNKTTAGCYCTWFLMPVKQSQAGWGDTNRREFESFARQADPPAGLLAYRDGEPVGWCALGPRSRYARMLKAPTLRQRDPAEDDAVWLVTCFFVRRDARRSGVTRALLEGAADLARRRGAVAIEGFPLAGAARRSTGEAFVGVEPLFASCGFVPVAHPSPSRVIMRRDLGGRRKSIRRR
jgi:GNAT superfamily N-acetyltransferase